MCKNNPFEQVRDQSKRHRPAALVRFSPSVTTRMTKSAKTIRLNRFVTRRGARLGCGACSAWRPGRMQEAGPGLERLPRSIGAENPRPAPPARPAPASGARRRPRPLAKNRPPACFLHARAPDRPRPLGRPGAGREVPAAEGPGRTPASPAASARRIRVPRPRRGPHRLRAPAGALAHSLKTGHRPVFLTLAPCSEFDSPCLHRTCPQRA